MPVDLTMPKLGLTMEEGTIVHWLAQAGDEVEVGQVLLEVQTDKVTVEVESPGSGRLGPLLVPEGETVPVGTLLARIGVSVESPHPEPDLPAQGALARVTPLARKIATAAGVDLSEVATTGSRVTAEDERELVGRKIRQFSSPRARKRAREAGLDWHTLAGSGPRGRIIERDVLEARKATASRADASVRWTDPTPVQRVTADRTATSFASAPHFYLSSEVSAEALLALRERLLPIIERRVGVRLTVTDLLVRVAAAALIEHPRANAFWQDGRIGICEHIHIGVATATENGLLVPVIRDADCLSLGSLAVQRRRLVEAARGGTLGPDDLAEGTFTLSNLGAQRVDQFQPVLNPPQSAILATGRIAERPFVVNRQLTACHTLILTLACDHRVLDGATAARFLDRLAQLIEEPYELFV